MSQPTGGIEVLLDLAYCQRSDKIVVVTQYPEIEFDGIFYPLRKFPKALNKSIEVNLHAVVSFSTQSTAWQEFFKKAVQ